MARKQEGAAIVPPERMAEARSAPAAAASSFEPARVLTSIAIVGLVSGSWTTATIASIALLLVEACFSLRGDRIKGQPSSSANEPGGNDEAWPQRMAFFTLRYEDPALERSFNDRRFRDSAAIVPSFCLVQILLCLGLGVLVPAVVPGIPLLVAPLAFVAAARIVAQHMQDAARAQSIFYWSWCASVFFACAGAAIVQTRQHPAERFISGVTPHGVAGACFLWAMLAAYARLFVVQLAPRLVILGCLAGNHVVFALAGTPFSQLEPLWVEPMLVTLALLVGELLGLTFEHHQRSAFLAAGARTDRLAQENEGLRVAMESKEWSLQLMAHRQQGEQHGGNNLPPSIDPSHSEEDMTSGCKPPQRLRRSFGSPKQTAAPYACSEPGLSMLTRRFEPPPCPDDGAPPSPASLPERLTELPEPRPDGCRDLLRGRFFEPYSPLGDALRSSAPQMPSRLGSYMEQERAEAGTADRAAAEVLTVGMANDSARFAADGGARRVGATPPERSVHDSVQLCSCAEIAPTPSASGSYSVSSPGSTASSLVSHSDGGQSRNWWDAESRPGARRRSREARASREREAHLENAKRA